MARVGLNGEMEESMRESGSKASSMDQESIGMEEEKKRKGLGLTEEEQVGFNEILTLHYLCFILILNIKHINFVDM